jgi:hypothetical protein
MADFIMTVVTIVRHTPSWVWALYALLLFLGFQRTRDSAVPLWRILILPAVVAALAISTSFNGGLGAMPAVLAGLVIGGAAGWRLEREGAARRLPDGRIWLRGEWGSFFQLAVVLVFRYITSVVTAMDAALRADLTWHLGTLLIGTTLSALFLGRTGARLRVYRTARPDVTDLGMPQRRGLRLRAPWLAASRPG